MLRLLSNNDVDPAEAQTEEASLFMGIFICLVLLFTGMLIVYFLRHFSIEWFPESWVFFSIGLFLSAMIHAGVSRHLEGTVNRLSEDFGEIFFVLLLPPIIFESGFSMNKKSFFGNFGAICVYAFLGTFISFVIVGVSVWLVGLTPTSYSVSFLDALCFGAIISATDPVTVLATFQALGVDETLYALIFGESVMNDAVAIVLYHTLLQLYKGAVTVQSLSIGLLAFFVTFSGSLLIGAVVGALSALLFKHIPLRRQNTSLERVLVALTPFLAYMLAEGLQLSGVVAILFAGIAMAHYTVRNLSGGTRRFAHRMFQLLASVTEALVFVYIGIACPRLLGHVLSRHAGLVSWSILACLVGRAVNIYVCTSLVNKFRPEDMQIERPTPFLMWFSGLRGGVAFALASSAKVLLPNRQTGEVLESVTLFIVVLSMTTIGGSIGPLLRRLGLAASGTPAEETGGAMVSLDVGDGLESAAFSDEPPHRLPWWRRLPRDSLLVGATTTVMTPGEAARSRVGAWFRWLRQRVTRLIAAPRRRRPPDGYGMVPEDQYDSQVELETYHDDYPMTVDEDGAEDNSSSVTSWRTRYRREGTGPAGVWIGPPSKRLWYRPRRLPGRVRLAAARATARDRDDEDPLDTGSWQTGDSHTLPENSLPHRDHSLYNGLSLQLRRSPVPSSAVLPEQNGSSAPCSAPPVGLHHRSSTGDGITAVGTPQTPGQPGWTDRWQSFDANVLTPLFTAPTSSRTPVPEGDQDPAHTGAETDSAWFGEAPVGR